jgi:hypothetical protein
LGHPRQDNERPYCTALFRLEPTMMPGSAIPKAGRSAERNGFAGVLIDSLVTSRRDVSGGAV